MKKDLFGLYLNELGKELGEYGVEPYRARQIAGWMYGRGVTDFEDMTNLSKKLRLLLSEHFDIGELAVRAQQHSQDRKTTKYLLELKDGNSIETVLMRHPYGNSVCVSSQVGCAMGCSFCASTLQGMTRNLTAGEILSQVFHFNRILAKESGAAVNSIVMMGSGEPLANYEQVLRFIRLCHEEYCLNMSYRNITLSTSGIVPAIERLAEEGIPVNLSISLHAPNDDIRDSLMPINKKYPLKDLLNAAGSYAQNTGRRITYEYTLIKDVNDQPRHARELAARVRGQLANVNLIPVNSVAERGLIRPEGRVISEFENMLKKMHIAVTLRKEMGADIQAACGQLRNKMADANKMEHSGP